MKVITIKQPWASLIVNGYKIYEFRSWKTNYRGKLLIHASKVMDKSVNLDSFKKYNLNYNLGDIIGEVELIDCILVTKKFEQQLIDINKDVYGQTTNRTGYAWILDNAKKIPPIKAKGKLNFWNYTE